MNSINQYIIGTKEVITKAIKIIVSSAVLHAVLRTADGADIKGIDKYQLHEVSTAVLDGSDHPMMIDAHEKLLKVFTYYFDSRRKAATNLEALCTMAAKIAS